MPDDAALARRYRRLLLAYPRWHRRLHAADMVTTMLAAAADGRGVTGRRATAALVLDGLRCRVRVRGVGAWLFAVLASLIGAGALAAAAGWGTWRATAAPWPTVTQAITLAAPVLPDGPAQRVTRFDNALGGSEHPVDRVLIPVLGDPEWGPGGVRLEYVRPAAPDRGAARAAVSARLAAAGWRTYPVRGLLVGERDGMRVTVLITGRETGTDDVIVSVYPVPPPSAYTAALIGVVAGAAVGWLLAAAGIARVRRADVAVRIRAGILAGLGAVAATPAALVNILAAAAGDTDAAAAPPWLGLGVALARPGAIVGAGLLLLALHQSLRRAEPATPAASTVPATPAPGPRAAY